MPVELDATTFVPFIATKLRSATVAWLNERWFLCRGIDVSQPPVRHRVEHWLVESFGFLVQEDNIEPADFAEVDATFHAERYGATGLSPNGGGGRAGIANGYCVKGIGRTPLVGCRADWQHSNGRLLLEEALREAIYSEILACGRPESVVPIIAILDTGISIDADRGRSRRALSIRPLVGRLAHFERATFFKPAFQFDRAQQTDAIRTARTVRAFVNARESAASRLKEIFAAIAGHIAHGHVHRLFHGGLYSANVSTLGALLDFGSSRRVDSWAAASYTDNGISFGEELKQLRAVLHSVLFFFVKYGAFQNASAARRSIWRFALRSYLLVARRELLKVLGVPNGSPTSIQRRVFRLAWDIYQFQQESILPVCNSAADLLNAYGSEVHDQVPPMVAARLIDLRANVVYASGIADAYYHRRCAEWLLGSSSTLSREAIQHRISLAVHEAVTAAQGAAVEPGVFDKLFADVFSVEKRPSAPLPAGWFVRGQRADLASLALALESHEDGREQCIVSGPVHEGHIYLFGKWYELGPHAHPILEFSSEDCYQTLLCASQRIGSTYQVVVGNDLLIIETGALHE